MSNLYHEMRVRQQEEVNHFPLFAAFNDKQFREGMRSLGLDPSETKKICSLGFGCFARKTDAERWKTMGIRHQQERKAAIAADFTGEGFVKDMFSYELSNHEFSYTGDVAPALAALGITPQQIAQSEILRYGFTLAVAEQRKE